MPARGRPTRTGSGCARPTPAGSATRGSVAPASPSPDWPSSAPRRRSRWWPSRRCPATCSTRSSAASRSAEAGIRVSEQGKGTTLLASATTRLDEVSRLDAEDHPAEIADTLDDFTAQATEASDLLLSSYAAKGDDATVVDLRSFTAESMTSLSDLDGQLPDERPGRVGARGHHADAHRRRGAAGLPDLRRYGPRRDRADPAHRGHRLRHGRAARPQPARHRAARRSCCPRCAGDLPPGSVTKPSPTAGPGGGPTAGQPTGDPTTLPTGVPTTGVPTSAVPTVVRPTAAATPAPWCSRAST